MRILRNSSLALRGETRQIQLVYLKISDHAQDRDQLQLLLSEEEKERARQLYFPEDGIQFVVTRAILRVLIGKQLRVPPESLHFAYNTFGKPSIILERSECALQFSLSHSGDLALYSFAYDRHLGVDIEKIEQRKDPFDFPNWTLKEAYTKAIGSGIFEENPVDSRWIFISLLPPAGYAASLVVEKSNSPFHIQQRFL